MKHLLIIGFLFWGPTPSFAGAKQSLVITGSSTIAPVISDLAKMFEIDHQGTRIDVQTGGSSRGVLDARKALSQIGMVSRALKEKESDLTKYTIAKDGIAIILHKSNSVKDLSKKEIVDIYQGKITNWKELGGEDKKIVVVNKAEGRSTLELFLKYYELENSKIKASVVIGDNEQGIKTVSKNPNAIGYVSIGTAEYNASVGVPLRLMKIEGVEANVKNVENASYPITRELNLVTKGEAQGLSKKFLDFVLSSDGSDVIREHYFVPVSKKQ